MTTPDPDKRLEAETRSVNNAVRLDVFMNLLKDLFKWFAIGLIAVPCLIAIGCILDFGRHWLPLFAYLGVFTILPLGIGLACAIAYLVSRLVHSHLSKSTTIAADPAALFDDDVDSDFGHLPMAALVFSGLGMLAFALELLRLAGAVTLPTGFDRFTRELWRSTPSMTAALMAWCVCGCAWMAQKGSHQRQRSNLVLLFAPILLVITISFANDLGHAWVSNYPTGSGSYSFMEGRYSGGNLAIYKITGWLATLTGLIKPFAYLALLPIYFLGFANLTQSRLAGRKLAWALLLTAISIFPCEWLLRFIHGVAGAFRQVGP